MVARVLIRERFEIRNPAVIVDLRLFISGRNKRTKDYSDYSTLDRVSTDPRVQSELIRVDCFRIQRNVLRIYAFVKNNRFKKFTFEAGQGARDFSRRDDPEIVSLDTFIFSLEKKEEEKEKQWLSFKNNNNKHASIDYPDHRSTIRNDPRMLDSYWQNENYERQNTHTTILNYTLEMFSLAPLNVECSRLSFLRS